MFKFAQTQIMPSSFEDCCPKWKRNHIGEQRNISLTKLLLQVNGMRAYHNLLFRLNAVINRRQQVTEGFPCACACFDQQVLILIKGLYDISKHHILSFPFFIPRKLALQIGTNLIHKLLE
ncbi:hypothetical protein D3C72_805890 [compost metagenome]